MAFSKHHLYDPIDQITGNYAHCISHAARILIIKQLLCMGPTIVQVLARDHPIHKESLSGHLKILREFNIIHGVERYPYTFYSINYESLKKVSVYLTDLLNFINAHLAQNPQPEIKFQN